MWPVVRRFGLMTLSVVSLWLLSILVLNLTLFSAGGFVMSYLRALEAGDLSLAASRAGLKETPRVTPLTGEALRNSQVLNTGVLPSGDVVVQIGYELDGEEGQSLFVVREAEPVLGFFQTWRFHQPPTATLELAILGDSRVSVNDSNLDVTRLGVPPRVTVLVPGIYEASLNTGWVEAEPVAVSLTEVGSSERLRMVVSPTSRLEDSTTTALEDYLDECAEQGVLQPASCPFGITIDDRVIGNPDWIILDYPDVQLALSADRTSWAVSGKRGVAEVSMQVQSLFDGTIEEVTDVVRFDVFGVVTGTNRDEPVLNLY